MQYVLQITMKSKVLAISAISAAFVAIALTVGAYIDMADLFALVVASAFVILPLYYDSYKGCFLSFAAGGTLAFLFSLARFNSIVFPSYFLFFGIYPVISNIARKKNFNKAVWKVIGVVWCVLFFYGAYFYYTGLLNLSLGDFPEWLSWLGDNILYFLAVFAVAFYFVYDRYVFVVKRFIDGYLGRIIKK